MLQHLMRHVADIYSQTASKDSSGRTVITFVIARESLPCNVQPATSAIVEEHLQRDERVELTLYYIDSSAPIALSSRVVWNGGNYKVIGRKYDTQKGLWYRADLEGDQQ